LSAFDFGWRVVDHLRELAQQRADVLLCGDGGSYRV
jgi:hypothetical protein